MAVDADGKLILKRRTNQDAIDIMIKLGTLAVDLKRIECKLDMFMKQWCRLHPVGAIADEFRKGYGSYVNEAGDTVSFWPGLSGEEIARFE